MLKAYAGGDTPTHFQKSLNMFIWRGALELDIIETKEILSTFNLTQCQYSGMYKKGTAAIITGICAVALVISQYIEGFNPKIKLTRNQTTMESTDSYNFKFQVR